MPRFERNRLRSVTVLLLHHPQRGVGPVGRRCRQHDFPRHLDDFVIASLDGFQVVLHDALAALAEVFAQRLLDAAEATAPR